MKIIFDTNILIHIEDPKVLSQNLQDLLNILRRHGHQIFIHPASLKDINNDQNVQRKTIILSKLKGYPLIELPPRPSDLFLSQAGVPSNSNERNDNEILFAIQKNAADFLITEDYRLQKKAVRMTRNLEAVLQFKIPTKRNPNKVLNRKISISIRKISDYMTNSLARV